MKKNIHTLVLLSITILLPLLQSCSSSSDDKLSIEGVWQSDIARFELEGEPNEKYQDQIKEWNKELKKYYFVRTINEKEFVQEAWRVSTSTQTSRHSFQYTLLNDTILFKEDLGKERKAYYNLSNGVVTNGVLNTQEILDYENINLLMEQLGNGIIVPQHMQDIKAKFTLREIKK